jgi:uncharacterized delta-60 repeat protein
MKRFSMKSIAVACAIIAGSLCYAQEWITIYDGPANGWDEAKAIAVDGSGNVYVTGRSLGSGTDWDYATIKYNSSGDTVWVRRYNGPGNYTDDAEAIAVDGSGNVYVTGRSWGSGSDYDWATIKYNASGAEQWVRRYNGPYNIIDEAYAIAVDGSGYVYVTGFSVWQSSTSEDYTTIKYNSNGDTVWVRRYDGPPNNNTDEAFAIAVDGSGNVYVTGRSTGSGTSPDYATIKYNSSGVQQWVSRYNGPYNAWDEARAIAVDGIGNVYVTGYIWTSDTTRDFATIKYNSSGVEQWVRRYVGPDYDWDEAPAIAVDGSGNVYVNGTSIGTGTDEDYATIKYNSAGDTLWVRRYNGSGNYRDEAGAIAVDGSGNVYVTGCTYELATSYDYTTIKYTSSGDTVWVRKYDYADDWAHAIALDGSGFVYVTGLRGGFGSGGDYATIKYSSLGVEERGRIADARNDKLVVHPNPCLGRTVIGYYLPADSRVELTVYDLLGRLVHTIFSVTQSAGYHEVKLSSANIATSLPYGIYFIKLKAGEFTALSSLTILR